MQRSFAASSTRANSRSVFITQTYLHLLGAIAAFVGIEVFLFESGLAARMYESMMGTNWLLILGGFMVSSWLATRAANSATSMASQYLGLGLYVLAQAIIFVPLLFMANSMAPGAISTAAGITATGFIGLTAVVFATRKDFSFMGAVLKWAGVMALIAIVSGVVFGFQLGMFFNIAMVGLAGGAILYDTSNVLHHYPSDRYVAASLQLFASVAMLMWYVLRLVMNRD